MTQATQERQLVQVTADEGRLHIGPQAGDYIEAAHVADFLLPRVAEELREMVYAVTGQHNVVPAARVDWQPYLYLGLVDLGKRRPVVAINITDPQLVVCHIIVDYATSPTMTGRALTASLVMQAITQTTRSRPRRVVVSSFIRQSWENKILKPLNEDPARLPRLNQAVD